MVENIYKKIFESWESGNISTAYELTLKYMVENPNSVKVKIIQADLLVNLYRFNEAKKILIELLESANSKRLYYVYLQFGHFYFKKSDLKKSSLWYRKACLIEPKNPSVLIYISHNYFIQGRFEKAKLYLMQATDLNNGLIDEAFFNLGLIEKSLGNYGNAIDFFDKALSLDPDYQLALKNKNDCLQALNEQSS